MKKVLFLILISIVISNTFQFEIQEDLLERYKLLNTFVRLYSNNKVEIGIDNKKGLYCKANDYIEVMNTIFEFPSSHAISPFSLFPFKIEIFEILNKIQEINQTKFNPLVFSAIMTSYNLMYNLYSDKIFINNYLEKHNLTQYKNIQHCELKNFENYFPKHILGRYSLEKHHFKVLNEFGYRDLGLDDLIFVYDNIIKQILNNKF